MCVQASKIQEALSLVVRGLEADVVEDAAALWGAFGGIARLAGAARIFLARRVYASGAWREARFRSAAEYLAAHAGGSVSQARRQLDTCARLKSAGATAAALRDGQLSMAQTEAIADAVKADPTAEPKLLAM